VKAARNRYSRRTVVVAAAFAVAAGQPSFAGKPSPASASLGPDLQRCTERLPNALLKEQLPCLQGLRRAGPAASTAIPTLTGILARSDGATDHLLIAAVLDVFRSLGGQAAPVAETLSGLLPHRSRLYRDRDKILVARLRAYIMVTLSDIGVPPSALPAILDSLAHVDERVMPIEVGAAARAGRSLGPKGRALAPYLVIAISRQISEEEFSLERYEPRFPADEATTIQLEAVRCLGRISSAKDREVLDALRQFADAPEGSELDPRVVREARHALDRITMNHRAGSIGHPAVARRDSRRQGDRQ